MTVRITFKPAGRMQATMTDAFITELEQSQGKTFTRQQYVAMLLRRTILKDGVVPQQTPLPDDWVEKLTASMREYFLAEHDDSLEVVRAENLRLVAEVLSMRQLISAGSPVPSEAAPPPEKRRTVKRTPVPGQAKILLEAIDKAGGHATMAHLTDILIEATGQKPSSAEGRIYTLLRRGVLQGSKEGGIGRPEPGAIAGDEHGDVDQSEQPDPTGTDGTHSVAGHDHQPVEGSAGALSEPS